MFRAPSLGWTNREGGLPKGSFEENYSKAALRMFTDQEQATLRRLHQLLDEIAPELTGHGLPLVKCEAYNRVYDQPYGSS
jgi:hypothetical protein